MQGSARARRWAVWIAVAALAIASGTLRLNTLSQKQSIIHDEAISLLIAAGKLQAFTKARRDLANRWVSGSDWRQHLEIEEPWNFGEIRTSMARRDLHPPLYYWLLHAAGVVGGGLTPRTGGLTNTLLHLLGLLALFALAKRTTGHAGWALVAAAVWTFGGTAIATTYVARQYELLGLVGITSAWLLVRLFQAERRHWPWAALLTLTLAAGLLTHVHAFLLLGTVLVAGLLALAEHLARRHRDVPRPFGPVGPMLALAVCPLAGILFLLAHPQAIAQLGKLAGREQVRTAAAFEQRWTTTASTLTETFDQAGLGKNHPTPVLIVLGLLCLVPAVVVLVALLRTRGEERARRLGAALVVLVFLCSISAGTFGSYLGFMSMRHAMGARYLALVWPFLVLSLIYAGWLLLPRLPAVAVLPTLVLLASLGWSWRADSRYLCDRRAHYSPELQLAKTVVIDTSARGYLGQLLVHLRSDARVFVAHGADVRRHAKQILAELRHSDSATFVHMKGYGVTSRHGRALFALARSAKLRLAPSGRLAALLEPNADRVVLLVGRGDLRKLLKKSEMKALRKAGSSRSATPRKGASSWLLHDGRVLASEHRADARLTLSGASAGKTGVPFSLECGKGACEAALGTSQMTLSDDGLWVLVWSISAAKPLLATRLVAKAEATSPGETRLGTRGR